MVNARAAGQLTSPGRVHPRSGYQVNAFPTYWFIGRDGRIGTGSAPRPSAGAATVVALTAELAI